MKTCYKFVGTVMVTVIVVNKNWLEYYIAAKKLYMLFSI